MPSTLVWMNTLSKFEFDFQKTGLPKRWRKSAANQQRYRATLKQRRDPTKNDNVGKEVTEALVR